MKVAILQRNSWWIFSRRTWLFRRLRSQSSACTLETQENWWYGSAKTQRHKNHGPNSVSLCQRRGKISVSIPAIMLKGHIPFFFPFCFFRFSQDWVRSINIKLKNCFTTFALLNNNLSWNTQATTRNNKFSQKSGYPIVHYSAYAKLCVRYI